MYIFLSDDKIDNPLRIFFYDTPGKHPKSLPKESILPSPTDPPESVTIKILKKQVPQFMQDDNPQSFHASFYHPGESPSSTSSRFHPCEDEDVNTSLPWHIPLEHDTSIELASEVSRQEYISQKR